MAVKKGGLGRGLDSLFEGNELEEQGAAGKLRIMDVEPNREQPRRDFDEAALADLSRSIAEHGVLQPILVRPMPDGIYQIVAGERRWRAARAAGLTEIPAVVRELSDEDVMFAAMIENLQREDLNPIEEALGYQRLMDTYSLTQEEVARRLGKARPSVANALRLLKLPQAVQGMVREQRLSGGHAKALMSLECVEDMEQAAEEVVAGSLSVRDTEELVKRSNSERKNREQGDEKKPKAAARRAAFFDEVELSLSEAMGRRIKVLTAGKKECGTLVLDFFDPDDLKTIALCLSGDARGSCVPEPAPQS